jgi:hypothetical protein
MTKQQYKQYLQSPHWRKFRTKIYSYVRNCAACGSEENLNIHHLNYEHLYKETIEDVVVLCRICHGSLHRSEQMGFSRTEWIKLHCNKIYTYKEELRKASRRAKRKQRPDLIERARREALSHYTKQKQWKTVGLLSKLAPPRKKPPKKSVVKAWRKAHKVENEG